jgi:hypothetical protein
VTSSSTRAPAARAAPSSRGTSSTHPSADCTTLTATTSWPFTAETSSASSTSVTVSRLWAANGKLTLVNSPLAVSTLAPSGRLAATRPTSWDTLAPIATRCAGTPTSCAHARRATATGSSKTGGRSAPTRQRRTASATTSPADHGGTPMLAVSR